MRRILVTGANKGIGLAIARAILKEHDDSFVFLGSRDRARGEAAVAALGAEVPAWAKRAAAVTLDVGDDASVKNAAREIAEALAGSPFHAIVNNAGRGHGSTIAEMLEVNALGVMRVCDAFVPLIEKGGRVVNVTSAAGPSFVAECSPERQRFFLDASMTAEALRAFVRECVATNDASKLAARGLGDGQGYGLSKACANLFTLILAREHPELRVNACTPGFIETDMTRSYLAGRSAAEVGMKSPAEGTHAPMFLLFGDPPATGRYYGSDAKQSPLDRYRAPGSPEHAG